MVVNNYSLRLSKTGQHTPPGHVPPSQKSGIFQGQPKKRETNGSQALIIRPYFEGGASGGNGSSDGRFNVVSSSGKWWWKIQTYIKRCAVIRRKTTSLYPIGSMHIYSYESIIHVGRYQLIVQGLRDSPPLHIGPLERVLGDIFLAPRKGL